MPAVNIYVSDDLKSRMSEIKTNWSEICREAIEIELARQQTPETRATQEKPPEGKQWSTENLSKYNNNEVIIRYPEAPEVVVSVASFLERVHDSVGNAGFCLNPRGGRTRALREMLRGEMHLDLLIPTRGWLSGRLELIPHFNFKYLTEQEDSEQNLFDEIERELES